MWYHLAARNSEVSKNRRRVNAHLHLVYICRFLLKKHKDAKAFKVLKKIYKVEDKAQDELESIKLTLRHSTSKEKWTEKIKYFCNFSIIQR